MLTPEDAVHEHIRALRAYDLDSLVDGYADDAVLLVGDAAIVGKDAIGAMFRGIPKESLLMDSTIDSVTSHGAHVLVTYHHDTVRGGGDTFMVVDGKIVMQSVHMVQD